MKSKKIVIGVILIVIFCFIIPLNSMALDLGTDSIYKEPGIIPNENGGEGLDDIIKDAEDFERENGGTAGGTGSRTFEINQGELQEFSSDLFSVLLISATAVSIIVGILIGIKYMIGSVEEKAEYKKLLIPYLAGCAAVYGALGIWKLFVTVLGSV